MTIQDTYLQRKSYLERYIRGVQKKQLGSFSKGDKEIIEALREFMGKATPRDIEALLQNNNKNKRFGVLDAAITGTLAKQSAGTLKYFDKEFRKYIESEIAFNYKVFESEKPKPKISKVIKTVVAGSTIAQTVASMYTLIMDRLRKNIASSVYGGQDPIIALKGTKELNYKDGLFFWRDNRIIKPNVDRLINGVGWNARADSLKKIQPKVKLRWLGTLDGRMCKICAANEINSPYVVGETPPFPAHPRCRCDLVPDLQLEDERPFVSAFTSVKKIPKNQRKGKIGTVSSKTTYAQWFANQDKKFQRRWLGKNGYELYSTGNFELIDFVDPRTKKIYTIEQLDALY